MMRLFAENGPYKVIIDKGNILQESREISWNQNLFILYVDQPRGVGFSLGINDLCSDVECAATDMHIFLPPQFTNRPFYITGESYSGKYIPAIARKLVNVPNRRINLKGLAIRNPYTDPNMEYLHISI